MAFETLTSTAPGSTSTGSNAAGGLGFSPAGSPPIIVAFLSVGLFVAGMLSIRFWRLNRMRMERMVGQRHHNDAIATWIDVGEKPVLWDLCADEAKTTVAGWKDIMPLSVSTVLDMSESAHGTPTSRSERYHAAALRYCDALRTRLHVKKEKEAPLAKTRLRVAVPIALPSPRRQSEKEHLGSDGAVEYSIGLFDVHWQADKRSYSDD